MRPYSRPGRRPYPSVRRALHQRERALRCRVCPACGHPVTVHAVEGGQRVCTRGFGLISCRECAHAYAGLSRAGRFAWDTALSGLRYARRYVPVGREFTRPVILDAPESRGMF